MRSASSQTEGIIPALEPAHALAWVVREAATLEGKVVVLNLRAGRQGRADDGHPGTGRCLRIRSRSASSRPRCAIGATPGTSLVPYIGGAPGWLAAIEGAAAAGATRIEIGIPFSDPVMDGPVIQAASEQALAAGATPAGILTAIERLDADPARRDDVLQPGVPRWPRALRW